VVSIPFDGKPEAAQPGTHLVNARFNSNGDTAFAGHFTKGGPGRKSPVCIDQGGNNRCCATFLSRFDAAAILVRIRVPGVTGRNVSAARAQQPRGFRPPSTSVERRPMLVLERKEILRREGRIRLRSVRSPRFRRRPATVRRNTFLRSFRRGGEDRGPVLRAGRRGPDRAHPACVSCGGSPALLSPGDGERNPRLLPASEGDGWETGPYGIPEPSIPAGVAPRLSGWDIVVVPGLAFDRRGIVSATGSGITTGFSEHFRRACRGSGSPGQASGFRKCRSTRGRTRPRAGDGRKG